MAFAEVTLKVAGKDLAESGIRSGNITLRQPLWGHHEFDVECLSLVKEDADAKGGASEALDKLHDALGQDLELEARWKGGSAEQGVVFRGVVTRVSAERALQGAYSVVLAGHSPTIQLDAVERNRMWENMKVADILQEIAADYGSICDVRTSCSTQHPFIVQHGETDYHFLARLCARELIHMYYDGEKLVLADTLDCGQQSLTMGRAEESGSLHRFSLQLSARPGTFRVRTWNPEEAKHYVKTTSEVSVSGEKHPYTEKAIQESEKLFKRAGDVDPEVPPASLADLDRDVKNLKSSWVSSLVQGQGESDNLALDPGTKLTVSGVSPEQKGDYIITEITHRLEGAGQGYRNTFTCVPVQSHLPPRRWIAPPRPDVWSAIVEDTYDPEHAGRVKVRFTHAVDGTTEPGTSTDGQAVTTWARVASPHAGEGWGWVSLPEAGDEVLVAAVNGSLQHPVIIGSVATGKGSKAFDQIEDEIEANEGKVFLTKSGNRLLFRDTGGKETIEITTPDQKNRVTLTMDGGAKVEIATEGLVNLTAQQTVNVSAEDSITVESKKDIKLAAEGNLELEAKGKIDIKATSDAAVDGLNVNLTSKGGTVKASPSGVDIKGPMIKLN